MSTDYGFGCVECGQRSIVDNARHGDVPLLRAALKNLDAIQSVRAAGFDVQPARANLQIGFAINFAVDHRARGHLVGVFDEYGREWDACGKPIKCPACKGHNADCKLKCGHAGPCSAERAPESP